LRLSCIVAWTTPSGLTAAAVGYLASGDGNGCWRQSGRSGSSADAMAKYGAPYVKRSSLIPRCADGGRPITVDFR